MPVLEWIGANRRDDDNSQADPSRLINCYREAHGEKYIIKSVLGMTPFATIDGVFMREMQEIGGKIYAAHAEKVWRIDADGIVTEMADIASASDTTISGNNGAITVAADGTFTVIEANGTVSTPSTGAFSSVGSVTFLGQRTILTEKGGARIQWSAVADATSFDGLDFATAEARDDNLIRGLAINGQFWAFGERSIERWYLTGSGESTEFIAPLSGGVIDTGLKSFGLLAGFPNGAFFVGSDSIVYIISGGTLQPISSRGVETSVEQSMPERCFYYTDEGHKFCVLQFRDRPAWVYDISSGEWHERAEGYRLDRWSAVAAVQAYGGSYVGTELGGVYRMERTNTDGDEPLIRKGVSRTLEMKGERFTINRLQMSPQTGRAEVFKAAPDAGEARDAKIALRMSRDRGETWGNEKTRSLGAVGRYHKLVKWHALGNFYRANAEFTLSEPAETPMDATAFVELS